MALCKPTMNPKSPDKCYNHLSLDAKPKALYKCWCQELRSEPGVLSTIDLAISVAAHVSLHVGDIVKFGYVAVVLHVWAFVFGHGGEQIVDDFVRDERVTEVEFCDVWLE